MATKFKKKWSRDTSMDAPKFFVEEDHRIICTMTKPKSPYFCAIVIDPKMKDDWFLSCYFIKNNTNEIKYSSTFVEKDFKVWMNSLQSGEGFENPVWVEKSYKI